MELPVTLEKKRLPGALIYFCAGGCMTLVLQRKEIPGV